MPQESATATLSRLSATSCGVFRGAEAVESGVTRNQLTRLCRDDVIERVHPDTYCMTAVAPTSEQALRAALARAGDEATAAGTSAGELYGLEGVRPDVPEIVLPRSIRRKSAQVRIHQGNGSALMVREVRGVRTTGVECTLLMLAATLGDEAFEIACEDARRRRLTSVTALRAYLERFGRPGRPGVSAMRLRLMELDPVHAARSTLEVKTRRLLVASGITGFVREFPLEWDGRTYRYDFAFERERTILETNGRRWHDDPVDYEHDNERWSVPGHCGYRIVFATWDKVTRRPAELLRELVATMAA